VHFYYEVVEGCTEFLKRYLPVLVLVNSAYDLHPFIVIFVIVSVIESVKRLKRSFRLSVLFLRTTWGQDIFEFMNVNFTIPIHIESLKCREEVLLRHYLLVVDGSCVELLEINGAVAVQVRLLYNFLPLIWPNTESRYFLGSGFELIDRERSIIIGVNLVKLLLQSFQIWFFSLQPHQQRDDRFLKLRSFREFSEIFHHIDLSLLIQLHILKLS